MSVDVQETKPTPLSGALRRARRIGRGVVRRSRPMLRALTARFASSLTRRIVFLNLGGLVALAVGFLYINQFREGLIDARVLSLETQGEIIAAAISASASVNTDAIQLDPEKLLQAAPGQPAKPADEKPADETNPSFPSPFRSRAGAPSGAFCFSRRSAAISTPSSLPSAGRLCASFSCPR